MSAIAAILATSLAADAAAHGVALTTTSATIGVDKTYSPAGEPQVGVKRWVDRSGGVPNGYPTYDFALRDPVNGSRNYKITARFKLPILETVSGGNVEGYIAGPRVAYTLQETREILIPERATAAERLLFFSLLQSFGSDYVNASDGAPGDLTGSPFRSAVILLDKPF